MAEPRKKALISHGIASQNRKARFDYKIGDTVEAGMVLVGPEVKSLRAGRATLSEAWAGERDGALWLFNAYADRPTSRVADVSSVVLRDLVIWYVFSHYRAVRSNVSVESILPEKLVSLSELIGTLEADAMAKALLDAGWGDLR